MEAFEHRREGAQLYEAGHHGLKRSKPTEWQWEHAEEFIERLDVARNDSAERRCLEGLCARIAGLEKWYTGATGEPKAEDVWECAVTMLVGECCAFTEEVRPKTRERWAPYLQWVKVLKPEEIVITFNYDRVPELLAERDTRGSDQRIR